jgi:hypothetical protein
MLSECGFNRYLNASKRRVPSVVYVNIKTPCPDWLGSAGKTLKETEFRFNHRNEDIFRLLANIMVKNVPTS